LTTLKLRAYYFRLPIKFVGIDIVARRGEIHVDSSRATLSFVAGVRSSPSFHG
jgi:hypothetical protein